MSMLKEQIKRLGVIDSIIRNQHYPTKDEIIWWVSDKIDIELCASSIEKDIHYMREHYDAPIMYCKYNKGYFYSDEDYSFAKTWLEGMSSYFDFPKEISSQLNK